MELATLQRSQRSRRQQKYQEALRTLTLFKMDSNTNNEKAIDLALFMEEVQRYDCLYNKFSKEYRDKCTKINCWNAVRQKFTRTQVLCLSRRLLRRKTPIIKRKHASIRSRRFTAAMLNLRNGANYVVKPRSPRSSFSDHSDRSDHMETRL